MNTSKIYMKGNRKLTTLTTLELGNFLILTKQESCSRHFWNLSLMTVHYLGCFAEKPPINRINRFHEKAFQLAYNNYNFSFHEWLEKHVPFAVHHSNIQSCNRGV